MEYNKDFTSITLIVDKDVYENSFDGFAVFGLGLIAMYYQVFDGIEGDKVKVVIDVKDFDTGEVFGTVVYPDALEDF